MPDLSTNPISSLSHPSLALFNPFPALPSPVLFHPRIPCLLDLVSFHCSANVHMKTLAFCWCASSLCCHKVFYSIFVTTTGLTTQSLLKKALVKHNVRHQFPVNPCKDGPSLTEEARPPYISELVVNSAAEEENPERIFHVQEGGDETNFLTAPYRMRTSPP